MARYAYPAVFTPEENGQFSVNFQDLESWYTCGDDMKDALIMAEDVLAFTLYDYERTGKEIPQPSIAANIELKKNEFINFVACDTMEYRKLHNNKSVKKTLTIPEWLNESAIAMGLNFSQVLQDALLEKIGNR